MQPLHTAHKLAVLASRSGSYVGGYASLLGRVVMLSPRPITLLHVLDSAAGVLHLG